MISPVDYPDSEKGRCRFCGFVAKHARTFIRKIPPPRFFEIESDERAQGTVFDHVYDPTASRPHGIVTTRMVCYVGAARFSVEQTAGSSQADRLNDAKAELNADRQCPRWYPYRPGFDPREHYEEWRMMDLERRREEVATGIAETARKMEEAALKTQQKMATSAKWQVLVSIGAVIVGALVVFAASGLNRTNVNNYLVVPTAPPMVSPTPTSARISATGRP